VASDQWSGETDDWPLTTDNWFQTVRDEGQAKGPQQARFWLVGTEACKPVEFRAKGEERILSEAKEPAHKKEEG